MLKIEQEIRKHVLQAKEAAEVEDMIKQAVDTPSGTKKACASLEDMPKSYHPRFVEAAW